ncbi:hypothetical protein AGDE_17082 [Angomonas deanei]|uniref:Uncharacterized protein n=1 Tax=Angomonas deanei TaxID=59799 RepID=A0A7G2CHI7_9TRYP|nr:hypothetical protein AGDE_17082 [Angomonas deanei]CAD2218374.1 hypothetical protein, conserved [Angomonas deanei]|eukprot:EPY15535.1 hypothetical protein AGDE_17082 [Angomonas deanei]
MEESVRSALGTSKHKSLPYNYEGSFFKSTTNDDDTSSKRRSGQYSYGGSMYKYDSTTTGQERTSDPYGMFEDYYDAQEDENDEEEALRKNFRRKVTERRMSRLHSDSTDRGYGSLMYPVGSIISLTEERSPNADNSRAATENFKHLAKQKRSSDETNNPYADFMELYTMEKVQFVSETTSEDPGKKNSKKRDDRKEGKTSNKGNNLMGILLNKPKKGESKSSTEKLVLPPAGKSPDMKPKMRNPLIAYESGTGKKM